MAWKDSPLWGLTPNIIVISVCAITAGLLLLSPGRLAFPSSTFHAKASAILVGGVHCPAPQPCNESAAADCPAAPSPGQCACPECPPLPTPPPCLVCPAEAPSAAVAAAAAAAAAPPPCEVANGSSPIPANLSAIYTTAYATLLGGQEYQASAYVQSILERIASYEPVLPRRAVQRGIFSVGEPARMRRFVHKLLSGAPVSIASVGGSITAGQGAIYGFPFIKHFYHWVNETSPGVVHTLRNGAFGGSTSDLFAACAHTIVQKEVDLVLVEFAVNDDVEGGRGDDLLNSPQRRGFERLLRKLQEFPNRPAVLLLNLYSWFTARLGEDSRAHFYRSAETELTVFGQYYALPIISLRTALYRHMDRNEPGFQVHKWRRDHEGQTVEHDLFYYDEVHPQDASLGTGHRHVSDLLISLVRVTATDLMLRPLGEEDEAIAQEQLPDPMLPGNYQRKSSSCLLQRDFEPAVVEQEGFAFRNERPNATAVQGEKWGWIAEAPGAWARLRVDTRDESGSDPEAMTQLLLSYLKSYQHMGRATVECVANCKCNGTEIDGHWEREASLSEIHEFAVTPHESCELQVTVLNVTSSGEHKVKLSGVMVASGIMNPHLGVQVDIISSSDSFGLVV